MFLAAAEVDRAFALVAEQRMLDNSHPVVADKRLVKRVTDVLPELRTQPEDDGTPEEDTTSGDEPSPGPVPDDGPTSDPLIELPDDTDLTQSDKTVRKSVEDGTKDITDGLSGVVETLLPDTDLTN